MIVFKILLFAFKALVLHLLLQFCNLKAKIWGNFAFKISFNVSNFSRLPKKKDRFCPLSMLKYSYGGPKMKKLH